MSDQTLKLQSGGIAHLFLKINFLLQALRLSFPMRLKGRKLRKNIGFPSGLLGVVLMFGFWTEARGIAPPVEGLLRHWTKPLRNAFHLLPRWSQSFKHRTFQRQLLTPQPIQPGQAFKAPSEFDQASGKQVCLPPSSL